MAASQAPPGGASSLGLSTSSSPSRHAADHHHHHLQSDHLHQHSRAHPSATASRSSAVASSSTNTLDHDEDIQDLPSSSKLSRAAPSHSSATRRRGSAVSPPSSPGSSPSNADDDLDPSSQPDHLQLRATSQAPYLGNASNGVSHAEHPNTSAMATLTVHTPPAVHQSDPMLQARSTNSPLHKPSASFQQHQHQHSHSASPPPPPAPYTQPPVTSSLATVTSGDGWAIVPKSARTCAAALPAVASPGGTTSTSATQPPTSADTFGLSHTAYAHAANDLLNRRCGPADPASNYDVPFGERASPAIISLAQRGARSLSRSGTRPPSPLTLSPALASESLNPSGAHRGGLRGSDEDVEVPEKDVAMANTDESCASTGATPLVPPATRKLCVRHQRMADEGTTARLQKVS